MEKDLQTAITDVGKLTESNFEYFQKTAAYAPKLCYNGNISQNDLGCTLQAKEGVLV